MRLETNFIPHITILQAFGVLSVILGHAISIYGDSWYFHPPYPSSFAKVLHHFIYAFHIPLFFFLSGYLFANSFHQNNNFFSYIIKRFKRLIIPYYWIGFFYYIPVIWIIAPFKDSSYATISLMYYHFTHCGPMWFLITLFITQSIYILLNFIVSQLTSKHKDILIFLIALIYHKNTIYLNFPPIFFHKALEYLIYIHIGFLCKQKAAIIEKYITGHNILYITPITIATMIYIEALPSLFTALIFITFFYMAARLITQYIPNLHNQKYIKFISTNMFTLYVLHEPFAVGILKLLNYGHTYSPFVTTLIIFFSTLIIIIPLTLLYNKTYTYVLSKIIFLNQFYYLIPFNH